MKTFDGEVYEAVDLSDEASFVAAKDDAGTRLDAFVAFYASLTRSAAVKLIESADVRVNGAKSQKNYKLREGDVINVVFPEPESAEIVPEDIPLDVVYEDSDIIVVNKPQGMVVHPAPGNPSGTLVNALMFHCKDSLSGLGGLYVPVSCTELTRTRQVFLFRLRMTMHIFSLRLR